MLFRSGRLMIDYRATYGVSNEQPRKRPSLLEAPEILKTRACWLIHGRAERTKPRLTIDTQKLETQENTVPGKRGNRGVEPADRHWHAYCNASCASEPSRLPDALAGDELLQSVRDECEVENLSFEGMLTLLMSKRGEPDRQYTKRRGETRPSIHATDHILPPIQLTLFSPPGSHC